MGDTSMVIGIVADVAQNGILAESRPQAYRLLGQVPDSWIGAARGLSVIVTGPAARADLVPAVRRQLSWVSSSIPLTRVRLLQDLVSASYARERFIALFVALSGAVALLLAIVGLYGVLTYWVGARTREIGVRMALGASRGVIVRDVVVQGLVMVAMGALIGTAVAAGVAPVLRTLLHGVQPTDPLSYGAALGLFLAVGLLSSGVPAWRAARLDPARTLRTD